MKLLKMTADFAAAYAACLDVAVKTEDGGTCNFDNVSVRPDDERSVAEIHVASRGAGLRSELEDWHGECVMLGVGCVPGQAAQRTKAAEALCNALRERGYKVEMFYMAD